MAKTDEDLDLNVEQEQAPAPKKRPLKKWVLIGVVTLVVLGGGTAAAMYFTGMIGGDETAADAGDAADAKGGKKAKGKKGDKEAEAAAAAAPKQPAIYHALDPAFVVNFRDQNMVRFLQITVELSTRDPAVVEAVKQVTPVIRNNLVLLFSSQNLETITTREGKERLREEALAEVRKVLKDEAGKSGVDAIYFTSFVMQ